VALDPESRTSNALVQILLAERRRPAPVFAPGSGDLEADLTAHDAAVRIGDKALFEPLPPGTVSHDLGEAWYERTRLPFVFAVWAARPAVVDRALYVAFHDSRREGLRQIATIADDYAWRGRRAPAVSLEYLTQNMRYRLGATEVDAMRSFVRAAAGLGLVPGAPEIRLAYFSDTACRIAAAARGLVRDEVRHG
jgi:chorismate dehydratase